MGGVIMISSRWKHERYSKIKGEGLTIDLEERGGKGWKIYPCFKKSFVFGSWPF